MLLRSNSGGRYVPLHRNALHLRSFLHRTDNVITVGGAVREPAVAVTMTVLLPTGVPGLPCALLPPPQAGIHKVASDNRATKLNTLIARRDLRFPTDNTSPRN